MGDTTAWAKRRATPYSARGILRVVCVRCSKPAAYQWQICSDDRNYRPMCKECDVELNELVLRWMGHPQADFLIARYKEKTGV